MQINKDDIIELAKRNLGATNIQIRLCQSVVSNGGTQPKEGKYYFILNATFDYQFGDNFLVPQLHNNGLPATMYFQVYRRSCFSVAVNVLCDAFLSSGPVLLSYYEITVV